MSRTSKSLKPLVISLTVASSCCGHIYRARMLFAAYSLCNSLNYRHRGGQWEEGRKHVCWPGSLLSSYSSPTLSSCACWAPAALNVYNLEEPQLNQNWNFKRRERKQAAFLTVYKRLIYSPFFLLACLIKKKKNLSSSEPFLLTFSLVLISHVSAPQNPSYTCALLYMAWNITSWFLKPSNFLVGYSQCYLSS